MTKNMKNMINIIKAMDNNILLNATDEVYDKWLKIVGNYYEGNFGSTPYFKAAIINGKWVEIKKFYNAVGC